MRKVSIISKTPCDWLELEGTTPCDELFEKIKSILGKLAKEETVCLITPLNIGPETLAAEAALRLRETNNIKLECVLPYEEQAKDWNEPQRNHYFSIIENCDTENMISTFYTDKCEQKCYAYMINTADAILLGVSPSEEVAQLIESSGKQVINI